MQEIGRLHPRKHVCGTYPAAGKWTLRTRSVFLGMAPGGAATDHRAMPHFLVEVHMTNAGDLELERAVRMLEAAQDRMREPAKDMRPIIAGISRADGRLICLIEAATLAAARQTVAVALLPAGRIREITRITGSPLLGTGDPRGDADARAETELVENVVDVGLDGPLGQE
jgi:hypothetical protein